MLVHCLTGACRDLIAVPRPLSRAAGLALLIVCAGPAAAQDACPAPEPVCAARDAVFAISGFDPYGSGVRIAPDLVVTNRHMVADETEAFIHLENGDTVEAEVVPTSFAGDLVLLRAALPPGPVVSPAAQAKPDGDLYTVGQDIDARAVRIFDKGRLLVPREEGKPLARLHHSAQTQPGTSGGALLNGAGELVGIAASGGEGRNEAIPADRIAALQAASGPDHAARNAEIGKAYRDCYDIVENAVNRADIEPGAAAERLIERCGASENRQLLDIAAQLLGRARQLDRSAALFERSLEMDGHAVNTRLGYVVTLVFARRFADAAPHVRWLIDVIPREPQIHQYAIQVGKFTGDDDLAERGLALIAEHNPAHLDSAKKFLDAPMPGRLKQQ